MERGDPDTSRVLMDHSTFALAIKTDSTEPRDSVGNENAPYGVLIEASPLAAKPAKNSRNAAGTYLVSRALLEKKGWNVCRNNTFIHSAFFARIATGTHC